jgi:hypothetical protein
MQLGVRLERLSTRIGLTTDRRGLVRTGVLLALLYALYAAAFPDREQRVLRHLFGWGGTLLFLLLWWCGARQIRTLEARAAVPWRLLVGFFVLFALLAAAIRPFHSSDLYAYVTVGRLQATYDLDPYGHTAADVPGWAEDPLLSGTWKDVPCAYGFLFAALTEGVVRLGGGDLERTLLLFKLLGVLTLAACAWLTVDTMRRSGVSGRGLALFTLLWSPYVLLHFVANGHNDLLMALCVLLAFRFTLQGRWLAVVPAIIVGALVKHLALVLLPFAWILLVRRRGWTRAVLSTLAGLAIACVAALPHVAELPNARWEQIGTILTTPWNSFQAALTYSYAQLAAALPVLEGSAAAVTVAVRVLFGLAFLAFYAWRWLRAVRRADYDAGNLVQDGLVVLFVLLCVASAAWHPWYLGMFLPAIFLLPRDHPVRELTLSIAAFQMLAFTPLAKARVLEALVMLALPMALWWRGRGRARGRHASLPLRGTSGAGR